jgi:hypothetical protein
MTELKEKVWEGLATSCSSTSTTPDITSACAFVRDEAKPRSTKSLSMRSPFMATLYQKLDSASTASCQLAAN